MSEYTFSTTAVIMIVASSEEEARRILNDTTSRLDEDVWYGGINVYLPGTSDGKTELLEVYEV